MKHGRIYVNHIGRSCQINREWRNNASLDEDQRSRRGHLESCTEALRSRGWQAVERIPRQVRGFLSGIQRWA